MCDAAVVFALGACVGHVLLLVMIVLLLLLCLMRGVLLPRAGAQNPTPAPATAHLFQA